MPMVSRSCSHIVRPNMAKYKEKRPVKYACLQLEETQSEFIQEEMRDLDIHFLDKWRKYEDQT